MEISSTWNSYPPRICARARCGAYAPRKRKKKRRIARERGEGGGKGGGIWTERGRKEGTLQAAFRRKRTAHRSVSSSCRSPTSWIYFQVKSFSKLPHGPSLAFSIVRQSIATHRMFDNRRVPRFPFAGVIFPRERRLHERKGLSTRCNKYSMRQYDKSRNIINNFTEFLFKV